MSRSPTASTLSYVDGEPLARCLLCRLDPLRLDPLFVQTASLPQLGAFSAEARQALLSRMGHTDEPSLWSWAKHRGVQGIITAI